MLRKITEGYVVQEFDPNLKEFVSQEFIAGDQCSYEDENKNVVSSNQFKIKSGLEAYLPFDMIQPTKRFGLMDQMAIGQLVAEFLQNVAPEELIPVAEKVTGGKIKYLGDSLYEVS